MRVKGLDFKHKKIFFILAASYIIFVFLGVCAIYFAFLQDSKNSLNAFNEQVKKDIKYRNGNWDLSEYISDPIVPGRFRVSIFTTDGVVLERWRPIGGYYDISDFNRLIAYKEPQTIQTITNQKWRIYSVPIKNNKNNSVVGVLTLAYFNPQELEIENIDQRLITTGEKVMGQITKGDGKIDVQSIESREIPYDIAFQIVDTYNNILYKDRNSSSISQIPDYIDVSYVKQALKTDNSFRQVEDTYSDDQMLVQSKVIYNNNMPVGVIITGITVELVYYLLRLYVLFMSVAAIPVAFIVWMVLQRMIYSKTSRITHTQSLLKTDQIKRIVFSKKDGSLYINDQIIPITYATNQYYMCLCLFSNPKKKWENDELLDKFGEDNTQNGWRKVYDAMSAINNKTGEFMKEKLIVIDNKTYKINPTLLDKIVKN